MTARNLSDCKYTYVEISTHHVGSIDAPSRGTVVEKSRTWQVGTRRLAFSKRKAAINLNKEECIEEMSTQT
jgi:hypothetical protein